MAFKTASTLVTLVALIAAGCSSTPPGAEKGPDGTISYFLRVESSEPGVSIETNSVFAGKTPIRIKIFGEKDGTFHKFGNSQFVVRALPLATNQFLQTQTFNTGDKSTPGARIPGLLFFDMNRKNGGTVIDTFPEN